MHILIFLGLCGYVPADVELSNKLCVGSMEAQYRDIGQGDGFDDFERAYFEWQISKLVWPHPPL